MQSKFVKSSKTVNRMISEGRITDLANYIKLGNSIEDLFLLTEADELAKNGVSMTMLANNGALVSLNALMRKLDNDSVCRDMDRSLLKHYGFVIERAIMLWKNNRLETMCSALDRELNERAVTHLMRLWQDKSDSRNPFVAYVDNSIVRQVEKFIAAIKNNGGNPDVSNDQLRHYTTFLENELLASWEKGHNTFKDIKSHLAGVLKDILLEDAKAGKLGEVLQREVTAKFREVLFHHISIVDDLSRYPALNDKFKEIYKSLMEKDGKITKNYTNDTLDVILQSYTRFDKKIVADINVLFRDEVIPFIIENHKIPIDLRRSACNRVICDQRKNNVNLAIGKYIATLLNSSVAAKVGEDIRLDQGSFKGVVEQIIRQAVLAFKCNDAEICQIMPDIEDLFADVYRVMSRLVASVDVHRSADLRIRELERSLVGLAQAFNQLKAEQAAYVPPSPFMPAPSAPPAANLVAAAPAAQGGRGLLGFFDRSAATTEPTSKANSTQSPSPKQ